MPKPVKPKRTKSEPALSTREIAEASLKLLNKVGMDGLTTRRLAQELGVQGPALYWHFPNMGALHACMAEILMEKAQQSVKAHRDWSKWLMSFGRAVRREILLRRDGARLIATATPDERSRTEVFPTVYQPLIDGGLTRDDAIHEVSIVLAYTLGWCAFEQGGTGSFMNELMDVEATFETGLKLLIPGLGKNRERR